jgi:ferredoxin
VIIFFTGTGNSQYLAQALSDALQDVCEDARLFMKENKTGSFTSETPYVFVFPTYAWRMPHVFERFLRESTIAGSRRAYFVMACGADTGNAAGYLQKLCADKGLEFCGLLPVVMPDNYVVMYDVTRPEDVPPLLARGAEQMRAAAGQIRAGECFPELHITAADKLKSGAANAAFFRAMVSAKKFCATDACVSCGLCERVCPLNNIRLADGRPVWSNNCTHCMACISRCPKRAIEYGRATAKRGRYYCPDLR